MKAAIKIWIIPVLLFPFLSFGQQVVSPSGSFFTNQNGSVSFTVGETIIGVLEGNGNTFHQGFQQPAISSSSNLQESEMYNISLFPNPAKNQINIKGYGERADISVTIVDIHGNRVIETMLTESCQLNVSLFPKGFYLVFVDVGESRHTEKLIIN